MAEPENLEDHTIFQINMSNYGAEMTQSLYNEYYEGHSFDVILKTGPEKSATGCHRLILALSSDFLRDVILTATPATTPVIILPEISTSVIKYVLLFMYKGEVHVPLDLCVDFIDACNLLELKGISHVNELPSFVDGPVLDEAIHFPVFMNDGREQDFDEVMQEFEPFQNVTDATNQEENKRLAIGKRWKVHQKISITPEQMMVLKESLRRTVRSVYESFGLNYLDYENGVELIMQGDKLLKGSHFCELCGRRISLYYIKGASQLVVWTKAGIKRHFERVHKLMNPVI